MQFNSSDYILFLFLNYALFWMLRRFRFWRVMLLLISSCFFYMSWNWTLISLILISSIIDYWAGARIAGTDVARTRRTYLLISLISNLGMLFLFKYADFFISSANVASVWLGHPLEWPVLHLILPVGISFYTFQTLSYTIDIYRRELKPAANFQEFFLFVLFFPQLVAGPIVRAVDLLPQLSPEPAPNPREGLEGIYRITVGLIKKVVFADGLALLIVDRVFERPELFSSLECLVGVYAYAFQIYFDFSAYSDIAIGSALLFSYRLPENFKAPYLADSLQDFWHRWHISLSTWLRDYLYIPLGGNKHGTWNTYKNLMLTMLLGGLWHGAAWTFVVWGLLHGVGLAVTRAWQRRANRGPARTWARPVVMVLTFHYVCLAWVFFRSPDFATAHRLLEQVTQGTLDAPNLSSQLLALLAVGAVAHAVPFSAEHTLTDAFARLPALARAALLVIITIVVKQLASTEVVPFIYFQF